MKNKKNHTKYTNIMAFNYKSEKGMGLTKSQQGTFVANTRLMAVNITKTYDELLARTGTRTSVYDCTRHYWRAKLARALEADYILGVAHGKVVAVYRPKEWHYTSNPAYSGRIAFTGDEIVGSAFIGMNLTAYFKNRNPVRYIYYPLGLNPMTSL